MGKEGEREMSDRELFDQLRRVRLEGLPGACVGCRMAKHCERGCAALRKVSGIVAEGGKKRAD